MPKFFYKASMFAYDPEEPEIWYWDNAYTVNIKRGLVPYLDSNSTNQA